MARYQRDINETNLTLYLNKECSLHAQRYRCRLMIILIAANTSRIFVYVYLIDIFYN